MTTKVNLRRILDRTQWEPCSPCPIAPTAGSMIISSNLRDQFQFLINSGTVAYLYDPAEDGWMTLPSPALGGTFAAGSCGTRHPWGPRAFATAGGSTTTIPTNLTLARDLRGYDIRILAGPNAGEIRKIASNTVGANAVITVDAPYATAITTASEFLMYTGRVWVLSAYTTLVSTVFRYYDIATNTWVTAGTTNLPASWGTDGRIVVTPGYLEDFITGAVGSSTSTVLTSAASDGWTVNQWANFQVRIASGTGAGQFRSVASNTANTVTVSTAWTITPDATSTFVLEGNSEYLYLLGNGAVTMYRYGITSASWTVLAPTTARSGAPVAGASAGWLWNVDDPAWKVPTNYLNGRYIYSFRGNGAVLDRYNIASNTWDNDILYSPKSESVTSGSGYVHTGKYIYISLGNTGRWVKYNVVESRMEPFSQLWYTQGTVVVGDRAFDVDYVDGAVKLKFLYQLIHTSTMMFRALIF